MIALHAVQTYKTAQTISASLTDTMASVKLSDLVKTYNEDGNISGKFTMWISKLELVAKLQKVDDLKSFVPLFLNGPAFSLYQQLSDDVKGDYEKLKKELVTAFSINCYSAYVQLRERVLQEGETVDVYLADLRRLVESMGQTSPEPLLKCSFVAGLPADVANQLKATAAVEDMGLNELVTRARSVLSTASNSNSSFVCSTVRQPVTVNKTVRCFTCSGNGHVSRECPTGKQARERKQIRCYYCNLVGHVIKNCPTKPQGNESGGASASDVRPVNTQ